MALHADGDNMLAIYASEKALRLAERLGRDPCRKSRARHLWSRVRPHRRHGQGAREPRSARWSSPAARTRARRCSRCWRSASTWRSRRATTRTPRAPTPKRSHWRSTSATCPRRSSCTPRSRGWRCTERLGAGRAATPTPAPSSPSAGPRRQALPVVHAARVAPLARWRLGRFSRALSARARAGRAGRMVGGGVLGSARPRHRDSARPGRLRGSGDHGRAGARRV